MSLNYNSFLVTGGAGFIGSNFIKYLLENYNPEIVVNLDKLTYAGNLDNTSGFDHSENYKFIRGDVCDHVLVSNLFREYNFDIVINFSAESHVDNSIQDSSPFITTNIVGTYNLLEVAKDQVKRFVQISTDEVYGSLGPTGFFTEETPLNPNSPYSASKASADMLVRAYNKTHNMDTIITRCSNNYGPYQFPEKLIPLAIGKLLSNNKVPIYGDGKNVRDWIYVSDHCEGIIQAIKLGKSGHVYNFGADCELTNLELVKNLVSILSLTEDRIIFVEDRKGHDFRYAIDNSKSVKELSWKPKISIDAGLQKTVKWYKKNQIWTNRIESGEYKLRNEKY